MPLRSGSWSDTLSGSGRQLPAYPSVSAPSRSRLITPFDDSIAGVLAATESGSDTFAAAGQVDVSGSFAATEVGADTFAASGQVAVSGTLAVSETGSDSLAASGQVAVAGTLAASEAGADTISAAGSVAVSGALAATESGADTFAGDGTTDAAPPAPPTVSVGGLSRADVRHFERYERQLQAVTKRLKKRIRRADTPKAVETALEEVAELVTELAAFKPTSTAAEFAQLLEAIDAAIEAKRTAAVLHQARLAAERARKILLEQQEEDEEDAIMALLLS